MPQCERLKWGAKMEEQEKEYEQDKWKIALRSELVIAMAGDLRERKHVYGEIGYYYQGYAPDSLYTYYSDSQLHLNSIFP